MILIAIDSFKGSLSSLEAGNAVKDAIHSLDRDEKVEVVGISDGGEGSLEVIVNAFHGQIISIPSVDAYFHKIVSQYGYIPEKKLAIIEIAKTIGIDQVDTNHLDPLIASSYGLGILMLDAIKRGVEEITICLGGSATNDAGYGMLNALGYQFFDENNELLSKDTSNMEKIHHMTCPDIFIPKINICSDVTNPLLGEFGATAIYGPQKGVTNQLFPIIEENISNFAKILSSKFNNNFINIPGTGAAGGLGFTLLTCFPSKIQNGFQYISKLLNLDEKIKNADLVITGEGRLDHQTVNGKVPYAVAQIAKKYDKFVIAICGSYTDNVDILNQNGIDAFFSILHSITTLDEALSKDYAYKNVYQTAKQIYLLAMANIH